MVLDLGLEIDVQKDGIKESSTCSFTTDEATSKAGRILNENRCISLLFLLLPDSANAKALKFCNQVEDGSLETGNLSVGEAILRSLITHTQKDQTFGDKILCALHLLRQYLAIHILQPGRFGKGGNGRIKKEFEGLENYYVDKNRTMLYKICTNCRQNEAANLMHRLDGSNSNFKRMETAFLTQFVKRGSQAALIQELKKIRDPEDISLITKDNADSMTLLGRNLPTDALELNFSRSKCLIISQERYNDDSYSDRDGTEQDVIGLTNTFKDFGCSNDRIYIRRNVPDAKGFKQVICDFKREFGQHRLDFVIVCILSHGRLNRNTNREEIIGTQGEGIPREDLQAMITDAKQCPELIGKPKIFLIQACRGQRDNDLMATRVEHSQTQLKSDGETMPLKASMGILRESWYVEAYSTPKNYVAFRDPIKGSPFIQAFCQTMKDYGDCFTLDKIFKKITSDLQRQSHPQSPEYRSVGVPTDLVFTRTK